VTVCRTTQYFIYVTAYVSIYTLVLMAGDRSVNCGMGHYVRRGLIISTMFRFLAVVYPVSSLTTRTVANVKYLILATWLLILLSNIPLWLTHSILQVDNSE